MSAVLATHSLHKEEGLYDAYARFVAALMCLRTSAFLKKGDLVRFVDEDAPEADAMDTHCPSCGRRRHSPKRLLCNACRARPPTIELGPTLADVMFRCGAERYKLTEEKKQAIVVLRTQQELAADALLLARVLMKRSFETHQRGTENVCFDRDFLAMGGSYASVTACGLAGSVVPVGGLGLDLRSQIARLAEEWLQAIEERTRCWHNIPVHADDNETVIKHVQLFAAQISNRVALLEPSDRGSLINNATLEHRAKVAFVYDEQAAEEQCARDVSAMALLTSIARHGVADKERWPDTLGDAARAALIELLDKPPPELLKILPQTVANMEFAFLKDTLGSHVDRQRTSGEVDSWRASINVETLCLLLQRATRRVEEWVRPTGHFIETVARMPVGISDTILVGLRYSPLARLPTAPWVEMGVDWTLLSPEKLARVRTGLRPAALRVVLLCSILRQMFGRLEGEDDIFAPGVVKCSLVHASASRASRAAQAAYEQLGEDMRPLMVGFEAAVAKHTLSHYATSHIDDDVRLAMRTVCRFSLDELCGAFAHAENNDRLLELVGKYSGERLSKPVLELAIPLLKAFRVDGRGWSFATVSSIATEILRDEPAIAAWNGGGELVLSNGELKNETKRLLNNLLIAKKISHRRVGSKVVWVLGEILLRGVLCEPSVLLVK